MLNRTRVVNTYFLASAQRSRHNLASRVNNVRRCAQRETYRSLLAPDDNRLTWLVGRYHAAFVSCACSGFSCSCWLVCCCGFFGRGRACLCKHQWRSQPADQSNNCLLLSDASFLIRFTPTVRDSDRERTLLVGFISTRLVPQSFEVFALPRFEWASRIR